MAEDAEGPAQRGSGALAAVAAAFDRAAGGKRGRDERLDAFLEQQTELLRLQVGDLNEQRGYELAHLRVRRWRDRLTLGLQAVGIAFGAAAAVGAGVLVWQASQARGLVIEAFSSPPDLVQAGMTGQVIAAEVEDRLNALQAQTQSTRAAESFSSNWGHDIKVEIPDTGVSVGELQRALRAWLGHETHVSGAVTHTPQGLKMTLRAEGMQGDAVSGPAGDTDGLVERAAEALYGRTQPFRYAVFLSQHSRIAESNAVLQRLSETAPAQEVAWAYEGLALNSSDPVAERGFRLRALQADPHLALAWNNLAALEESLGHDRAAVAAARATQRQLTRADHGGVSADKAPVLIAQQAIVLATGAYDPPALVAAARKTAAMKPFYGSAELARAALSRGLALSHDARAAREAANELGPDDAALAPYDLRQGNDLSPHADADAALGDWPAAAGELARLRQALAAGGGDKGASGASIPLTVQLAPAAAEALARSGRIAEAQALIAPTRLDCRICVRIRGEVAAAARDFGAAERWFAEAVRQDPEAPDAYIEWARARLARGQTAGALSLLDQARKLTPSWADPQELAGEALLAQGDAAGAVDRFRAADRLAPRWSRNHMLWGQALWSEGQLDAARAQFAVAAGLDPPVGERAALAVLRRRIGR